MSNDEQQIATLDLWPLQQLVKKSHGTGRVCQARKPDMVECRDQQASCDPHRFVRVVVRRSTRSLRIGPPAL